MLQKFALAVKTKTIEFFAEDDDDDADDRSSCLADPDSLQPAIFADLAPEAEVITGQRVVVLKPDPPPPPPDPDTLAAAAFATVSSFRSAYLHLQTADSPFQADALRSADRAAVSHLRRLSDLKRLYFSPPPPPAPALSSHLEAQVLENQSLLRAFEAVANRLQSDIDHKDAEAAGLDRSLRDLEATNLRLSDRLERACAPPEENVESLLSVGVFDGVLRDTCRVAHRFARVLVDLLKRSGWDLRAAADGIHPGVKYAKPGHCRYAILSYVCLGMLGGFDSYEFCCRDGSGSELDEIDVTIRRNDSLQQFIEHSDSDALIVMRDHPTCDFAKFCRSKYEELIHPGIESALLGQPESTESLLRSFTQSSPLYEPFVSMASSIWMLHKLAWAYDPVVEIFQVSRGTELSMVFMENIARKPGEKLPRNFHNGSRPKVGFTVVPGFRVGKTVIQCRVYLEGEKQPI